MIKQSTLDKYLKFIGKTFGSIRVDEIDLSTPNRIYFICTCLKCNNKIRVRNDGLNEKTTACKKCMGVWRKENFLKKYSNLLPKDIRHKYIHFKCNAKRKNKTFSFELTKEEVIRLCESPCYYCGKQRCLGIDRVDNAKGYTIDNCVPCCGICNNMKRDLSQKVFLNKVQEISNNLIKSSTTISKESTSQANGDGKGELLTAA